MKRFLFVLISITMIAGLLSGCSVNASKVDTAYAEDFLSNATFVKDKRTGMCFGMVATRKTLNANQNGISWTWVPCEMAEKYLVN